MYLRCMVRVGIEGLPAAEAAAVREALEPDNVRMPEGLDVAIRSMAGCNGSAAGLTLEFSWTDRTGCNAGTHMMGSLIGTVDEVLEHAQVALRVVADGA